MNREILFKAKRKDNGEWVEGIPIKTNIGYFISYDENPHYCNQYGYMEIDDIAMIDENTICQYTGLTDKNGKKIWENDILKANLDESYPEDITYIKILWNEYRFCTNENYSTDIETLEKWDSEHFQVCGNVFDNADLLEVE